MIRYKVKEVEQEIETIKEAKLYVNETGILTLKVDGWCIIGLTKEGTLERYGSIVDSYLKLDEQGKVIISKG